MERIRDLEAKLDREYRERLARIEALFAAVLTEVGGAI